MTSSSRPRGIVPRRAVTWSATIFGLLFWSAVAGAQVQWVQAPGTAFLQQRVSSALAYDSSRQRIVLFGGSDGFANRYSDTWEHDGTGWLLRNPRTTRPTRRIGHAMAYDARRGRTVLFGGNDGTILGDTWEWDGTDWARIVPPASPPARQRHALVYDAARGRTVLFGGYVDHRLPPWFSDTWEWDGTTWVQRSPATSPPGRYNHAMAYDSLRGRTVLFGGTVAGPAADTWEWDGSTWIPAAPAASPPARLLSALAFDTNRGRTVLFGGWSGPAGALADTWEWDGASWVQRFPATSPPALSDHAMAYDAARGVTVLLALGTSRVADTWEWTGTDWRRAPVPMPVVPPGRAGATMVYDEGLSGCVLFGGASVGGYLTDTWLWDGTTWTDLNPPAAPTTRQEHAMAYDASRRRIVLFAGAPVLPPNPDTWEFDGTTWTQRFPANTPSDRFSHAMAYDAARRRTVLFGGGILLSRLGDTWEWDGNDWTQRTPPVAPQARSDSAMAYDAGRGRTVLFGGFAGSPAAAFSDTWEWDGMTWNQATPPASPPARGGHSMAFDSARGRVTLFGGITATGGPLNDTWEWDGSLWTERIPDNPPPRVYGPVAFDPRRGRTVLHAEIGFALSETWEYFAPWDFGGPGHPKGGLPISYTAPPWIGTTTCVTFSLPPPRGAGISMLFLFPAPPLQPPISLNHPWLCAPASQYVAVDFVLFASGDPAVFCITIPPSPRLVGLSLTVQGATLESAGCLRATDALVAVIQG